jgi:very-short-patch-repair endonuclease
MTHGLRPRRIKREPSIDELFPPGERPPSGNTGFKRARELRAIATTAERKLWQRLRGNRIRGAHFRRQHPLGPYFVDFACLKLLLIIEVDGAQHAEPDAVEHDRARSAWLERHGYKVLRFPNGEVLRNTDGVVEMIDAEVMERLKIGQLC